VQSRVLSVKSEPKGRDRVEVSIEDSGIGIDPANIDRIFERLFTTKENGMGMVFPSAIRSSKTTAVEFGRRRPSAEGRSFNLNCQLVLPRI
jgi:C4-dicarboxylate-specific signal transduction histidine kinase